MKLCKDCKYFDDRSLLSYCKNPKNGIEPVYGEPNGMLASIARSKDIGHSCGPDGNWFDRAEVPVVEVKKRRSLLDWFKDIGNE